MNIFRYFYANFYDGDGTRENSLKITVSEWGASRWSKISGRRGHPPPTICARIDRPVNAL